MGKVKEEKKYIICPSCGKYKNIIGEGCLCSYCGYRFEELEEIQYKYISEAMITFKVTKDKIIKHIKDNICYFEYLKDCCQFEILYFQEYSLALFIQAYYKLGVLNKDEKDEYISQLLIYKLNLL